VSVGKPRGYARCPTAGFCVRIFRNHDVRGVTHRSRLVQRVTRETGSGARPPADHRQKKTARTHPATPIRLASIRRALSTENPWGRGNEANSPRYWARITCSCRNVSGNPAFSPQSSVKKNPAVLKSLRADIIGGSAHANLFQGASAPRHRLVASIVQSMCS